MEGIKAFVTKNKVLLIVALFAIVILPKIIRALVESTGNSDETGGGVSPVKYKCNISAADRDKVFGIGTTKSNEVCYLQHWLNTYYGAKLAVDGTFGPKTQSSLSAAKSGASFTHTLNTLGI